MNALKPCFAALLLILGLTTVAQAQYAPYPGVGTGQINYNQSYYSINGGFGNYGLPGAYPGYQGYGFSGYGPGSQVGAYFTATPNPNGGKVSNNMGGLINSIKQQTGKPGSYRNSSRTAVSQNRRGR